MMLSYISNKALVAETTPVFEKGQGQAGGCSQEEPEKKVIALSILVGLLPRLLSFVSGFCRFHLCRRWSLLLKLLM